MKTMQGNPNTHRYTHRLEHHETRGCKQYGCVPVQPKSMQMNTDPAWLKKMTDLEDGCDVSVGGMLYAEDLKRLCTAGVCLCGDPTCPGCDGDPCNHIDTPLDALRVIAYWTPIVHQVGSKWMVDIGEIYKAKRIAANARQTQDAPRRMMQHNPKRDYLHQGVHKEYSICVEGGCVPVKNKKQVEKVLRIDINNLRFYASMFRQHEWSTDVIDWRVFEQTLKEIADRMEADMDAANCSDCPPIGYPTDKTRCIECPRRKTPPLDDAAIQPTPSLAEKNQYNLPKCPRCNEQHYDKPTCGGSIKYRTTGDATQFIERIFNEGEESIINATDEEILAECAAEGIDPDSAGRIKEILKKAVARIMKPTIGTARAHNVEHPEYYDCRDFNCQPIKVDANE